MVTPIAKKRNFYLSYLKGLALIGIIVVHLIEWSNIEITTAVFRLREFFYPAVFLFLSTGGAVTYYAYSRYDDLHLATRRLITRGAQLVGIYFLYNIFKFFIYNFKQEPFYDQFVYNGKFTIANILTLHSFSTPISIILTIGLCLIVSPIFLWVIKKVKQPNNTILGLIILLAGYNYAFDHSANWFTNFIFAKNNILFPPALWLLAFLVGFYLAMLGLEKIKFKALIFSVALTILCALGLHTTHFLFIPHHDYMYPLTLYYIIFGVAYIYFFIYVFTGLEKIKNPLVKKILALIRFWGDNTLSIYILQWLVIDFTMWLWFPQAKAIWVTIPLMLLGYSIIKKRRVQEYIGQQNLG